MSKNKEITLSKYAFTEERFFVAPCPLCKEMIEVFGVDTMRGETEAYCECCKTDIKIV